LDVSAVFVYSLPPQAVGAFMTNDLLRSSIDVDFVPQKINQPHVAHHALVESKVRGFVDEKVSGCQIDRINVILAYEVKAEKVSMPF
jgi:hypothetical protein